MALIDPNKSTSVFDGIIHEPHSNALELNPAFFYADEGKGRRSFAPGHDTHDPHSGGGGVHTWSYTHTHTLTLL